MGGGEPEEVGLLRQLHPLRVEGYEHFGGEPGDAKSLSEGFNLIVEAVQPGAPPVFFGGVLPIVLNLILPDPPLLLGGGGRQLFGGLRRPVDLPKVEAGERLGVYGLVFLFFPGLILFAPFINLRMAGHSEA